MALLVGELKSVLDLDTRGFDKGLSSSEAKFKQHGKKIGSQAEAVAKQAGNGMAGAERSSFRLQGTLGKLGGVAGRASVGLGGIAKGAGIAGVVIASAGGAVVGAGMKITDYAGKLDLLKKKSATVFGSELGRVQTWAAGNAHAMGVTKSQAVGMAAGFADLLIPMGFTRKAAAGMSTDMIGLSGALSEWSGGTRSAAEVSEILSAAMMGERDALQGLGISISQAEVDAKALEMGLAKGAVNLNQVKAATLGLKEAQGKQAAALKEHGKGSMEYQKATVAVGTAQDRLGKATKGSKAEISDQAAAIATQKLIMEKSVDAQKAYADGAGSLARKSAESKAKLAEMGETLVTKATPMLLKIATTVNEDVLPALERFGGWLNDNRFTIGLVFVGIGRAVLGLVKVFGPAMKFMTMQFLDFVGGILSAAAKVDNALGGKLGLQKVADGFERFRQGAEKSFDGAIAKAREWDTALSKTEKELRLKGNISDLAKKLKTAKAQLADKSLTKERRAQIVATIKDLQAKLTTAHVALDAKWITKQRTAKLEADKRGLDAKIAAAKVALASPKLTATKTAQLKADIRQLERQKAKAQAAINSLKGKTVSVEIKYTSGGVNLTTPSSVGRRAAGGPGGPVDGPGTTTSDEAGLYRLSRKEWVVRAAASTKYGNARMAAVNAGRAVVMLPGEFPGLAAGGRPGGGATFQSTFDAASLRGIQKFAKTWAQMFAVLGGGRSGAYGGVKPWVAAAGDLIRKLFGITNIGGVGGRPGPSDHPSGHALDFMVGRNRALGNRAAAYMMSNRARMNLTYLIWFEKIASASQGWRWRPYTRYAGSGNATLLHRDHVHASFRRGVRGYELGTPYVPRDGLAYLHQGERVVSADQNSGKGSSGTMTVRLSDEDRRLLREAGARPITLDGRRVDEGLTREAMRRY